MSGGRSRKGISGAALEAFRAQHPDLSSTGRLTVGSPARVRRLERAGSYILVPIRDDAGLRGIVQLNGRGLSVEASAVIRDPSSTFLEDKEAALAAAKAALPGKRGWRPPFLAWRPCRESFDSMRPLWVIRHTDGEAYVTQNSEVFEALSSGRGG